MKHYFIAAIFVITSLGMWGCNNSATGDTNNDTTINRVDSVPLPGVTHDGLKDTSMHGLEKTMSKDSAGQ